MESNYHDSEQYDESDYSVVSEEFEDESKQSGGMLHADAYIISGNSSPSLSRTRSQHMAHCKNKHRTFGCAGKTH